MSISPTLLAALPKTDLHVHLDGSLRLPTLIALARERKVSLPSYTEEGLKERVFKPEYKDLPEYLSGFAYTVAVMQDAEALEQISYELAQDNIAEGVRHLEVRFAPQLHVNDSLDLEAVLSAVDRGMTRAQSEFESVREQEDLPFVFGVIVCALRWFNKHMSPTYRKLHDVFAHAPPRHRFAAASEELARAAVDLKHTRGLPIVGFDLAGAENGNPAIDHRRAFGVAHRHFLGKTVHAGEAYGPESIFQALTECHADRIGHATFLFSPDQVTHGRIEDPDAYVEALVNTIAHRRICIEVNLTSNLQTLPSLGSLANHPFKHMLAHNLSATLCTDNRLVSHTTVTRELQLAAETFDLNLGQVRNILIAGFKGAFYPGSYTEKRAYVRHAINRMNTLIDRQP